MKRIVIVCALAALAAFSMVSMTAQLPAFVPVTDQMLENPDSGDWLLWRRTMNSWGYSPLEQINKSNVGKLKMVWSRGMGPGIQEATTARLSWRDVSAAPQRLHRSHERCNR
jgi:glucose dehydrogenase